MSARRISAHNPLAQLRGEVDRLFSDFTRGLPGVLPSGLGGAAAFPPLNVWETDDDVLVEAELPGLSQDQVEIYVVGNELTIRGERPAATEEGVAYHRQERGSGSFSRAIKLPSEVDADRVDAALEHGVLSIRLAKQPAARPRKVNVVAR